MRVATRIGLVAGALVLLFFAIVGLHSWSVRKLARSHRDLARYHQARKAAAEQVLLPDRAYEQVTKFFVRPTASLLLLDTEDESSFLGQAETAAAAILETCSEAHSEVRPCTVDHVDPTCRAADGTEALLESWRSISTRTAYIAALSQEEKPDPTEWSLELANGFFTDMKREAEFIEESLDLAIRTKLHQANEQRTSTERIAIGMGIIAALTATLFVSMTVRSFLLPMRRLKEATRAVAEGQFRYKLDTSARDEFSGLSASFNRMVTKIAELDQLKSDFLSHVSHELKTPLAAMQETTSLLLDETPGEINPTQRRLLELTRKNCQRLTTMITQLLDLSRMHRGALPTDDRPHDFSAIVDGVVTALSRNAEESGVHLEIDLPSDPIIVRCDHDRLIQVIENLLTNAIKFSPPDGKVAVRLTNPAHDNHPRLSTPSGDSTRGQLLCAVTDRGPGVPDLHKEKIFERFHQADRRPKGSGGGIGLGLAICREIVAAHDGEIWVVDNKKVGGSTFYFTLPGSRIETFLPGSLTA